jgi:hypothetical protein
VDVHAAETRAASRYTSASSPGELACADAEACAGRQACAEACAEACADAEACAEAWRPRSTGADSKCGLAYAGAAAADTCAELAAELEPMARSDANA